MTDTVLCGHCGNPITTAACGLAGGAALCHTGTLPPHTDPADCYRLVTVYGHRPDGACCQTPEAATPPTPTTAPASQAAEDTQSLTRCVTVTYNDTGAQIPFPDRATVRVLLYLARSEFGIPDESTHLGLFTEHGVELDDPSLARELGVRPGDLLVLRPWVAH